MHTIYKMWISFYHLRGITFLYLFEKKDLELPAAVAAAILSVLIISEYFCTLSGFCKIQPLISFLSQTADHHKDDHSPPKCYGKKSITLQSASETSLSKNSLSAFKRAFIILS